MSESIVFAPLDDGVASVTINRSATRNALSLEVMEALIDTLAEVGRRTDVRAVIVGSAGHVFSSGHDLKEIRGADLEAQQEIFNACSRLMQLIQTIPQPVIAQVRGWQRRPDASSWPPATWRSPRSRHGLRLRE